MAKQTQAEMDEEIYDRCLRLLDRAGPRTGYKQSIEVGEWRVARTRLVIVVDNAETEAYVRRFRMAHASPPPASYPRWWPKLLEDLRREMALDDLADI